MDLFICVRSVLKHPCYLVTVEDHFIHGGLGDFATAAVSDMNFHVIKMAVTGISRSGSKEQLMQQAGIDASGIIARVKELI